LPVVRSNAEQTLETRSALVEAGRRLFTEQGYGGTSTEQIVAAADVTRGALYHHFRDKVDLFRSVYEAVERDVAIRVAEASTRGRNDDWLQRIEKGASEFLAACLEPDVQQIVLLDGMSTLGWDTWLEIDTRYGLGQLEGALRLAIEDGTVRSRNSTALAHLVFGALMQAGLVVARDPDPKAARSRLRVEIVSLLEGLRA
jgi:AcrR family transcriptional regulator